MKVIANMAMVHIQEPNDILTHFCVCNGYGGNVFKGYIKKVSKQSSMVWHLTERDEKIQQATTGQCLPCNRRWPFDR